jgi:hypothetical protein
MTDQSRPDLCPLTCYRCGKGIDPNEFEENKSLLIDEEGDFRCLDCYYAILNIENDSWDATDYDMEDTDE